MKAIFSTIILLSLIFASCKKEQLTACLREIPAFLTSTNYLEKSDYQDRVWEFHPDQTLSIYPDLPNLNGVFIETYTWEWISCDVVRIKFLGHLRDGQFFGSDEFVYYDLILSHQDGIITMIFDPINDLFNNTQITLTIKI